MNLNNLSLDQNLNLRSTQEKIQAFMEIFFHDESKLVAVSNSLNGKPLPATAFNIRDLLLGHLTGSNSEVTILHSKKNEIQNFRVGSYLIRPGSSKCKQLCIDIDGEGHKFAVKDPEGVLKSIIKNCDLLGLKYFIEKSFSGAGFHLWIFFDELVEASRVRDLGRIICEGQFLLTKGGYANATSGRGIEIFPKQDHVALGSFGNLIWLPWFHGAQVGNNCFYLLGDN